MKEVLEAKILLERELARPLYRAGATYIRAWERTAGNMSAWERLGHMSAVSDVLKRHYARVVLVMTGRSPSKDSTLSDAALSMQHIEFMVSLAQEHAGLFLRSLDNALSEGMSEAAPEVLVDDHTGSLFGIKRIETKAGKIDKIKLAVSRALNTLKKKLGLAANANTNPVAEDARRRVAEAEAQLNAGQMIKRWVSLMDGRERATHHAGHNDYENNPIPVDQPFSIGGFELMAPGDQSRGAPLREIINCFPAGTSVSGNIKSATRHWYEGDLVEIVTRLGYKLSGTPNHPVLTPEGWVALGSLHEGCDVICCGGQNFGHPMAVNGQDVDDADPAIEKVFYALAGFGVCKRESRLAVNFHGDRPTHDVNIVRANGLLKLGRDAAVIEHFGKSLLSASYLGKGFGFSGGLSSHFVTAGRLASSGNIGGRNDGAALGSAGFLEAQNIGFAPIAGLDAGRFQPTHNGAAGNSGSLVNSQNGHSGIEKGDDIITDRVAFISRKVHKGPVYNLECEEGLYSANGIIVHNCRCSAVYTLLNPDGTESPIAATPHAPTRRYSRVTPSGTRTPGPPLKPTSTVTLNGNTRARVVLSDARTVATLRQATPSTLEVVVGWRVVGRAQIVNGRAVNIVVDKTARGLGIEDLIRRSVTHSSNRAPAH